jgi:hypothetical protein
MHLKFFDDRCRGNMVQAQIMPNLRTVDEASLLCKCCNDEVMTAGENQKSRNRGYPVSAFGDMALGN